MGDDFRAFSCSVVLDNFHKKIEVLEALDDKILAGLGDGTLVVLQQDENNPDGQWQVTKAYKSFGQRRILQLWVWKSKGLLFSLSDEGVNAHHLPAFKLACQANRTRGANQFAFDETRAMLCVAAKRRLILLHYNGNEFVELKELGLPDRVLAMGWCGDSVCLGFQREYATVHANTGALSELFSSGKAGTPVITQLASGELLLAKDNIGIFIGSDGKPSRKVLPVKGMDLLGHSASDAGDVFVASSMSDLGIRRLAPLPFAEQASVLADREEFAAALELAALMPSSQAKRRLSDTLHVRYGHHLFAHGEYDEAMAHFGMCSSASPVVLLRLFPSLASPAMLEPLLPSISGYKLADVAEPKGDEFRKAVSVLLPYLLSHRTRLASVEHDDEEEEADSTDAEMQRDQESTRELSELTAEQRATLAEAVDTAILKAMLEMDDTGALLRFVQRPNQVSLAEGEAALRAVGRYSELVALYQSRGRYEAALDLLRSLALAPGELSVAPQGASAELAGLTGVWAAVKCLVSIGSKHVDLIKAHARWIVRADPEAGLEMFTEMRPALAPETVLPILTNEVPTLCAPYLEAALDMGLASPAKFHNELALIYLRMTKERRDSNGSASTSGVDDRDGREEAIDGQPGKSHMPARPDPLQRLKDLVIKSEHIDAQRILLVVPLEDKRFLEIRALLLEHLGRHQEALEIYVHQMKEPRLAEAYCDRMYEAAAKQKGQLNGNQMAAWSGLAAQHNYDMYLALIQVYLERQDNKPDSARKGRAPDSSNWEAVARLLSRKHDRIDSLHALDLLPGEVPLKATLPFLEGALRAAGEKKRNSAVVKSLRRSENLQLREEVMRCRQRNVVVTYERACSLCHKRIGTSAFVAYPHGALAHYSCYKRSAKQLNGAAEAAVATAAPTFDISTE
ncbi:Vam6/Vps39-like protein [Coccomyxa sp. Obi]|nr:Vam6/Vps39-like protein [Coccomyxa sp. Obi]